MVETTGYTQKQEGQIRKYLKTLQSSRKSIFGQINSRLTCTRIMKREKHGNKSLSKAYHIICKICGGNVIAWACMAANGKGSLVFIDSVQHYTFYSDATNLITLQCKQIMTRRTQQKQLNCS